MKKILLPAMALAAFTLAGCASPRTATIEDGKVSNITSAEAVTLVKKDIRQKKVADVQKNAKPILRIEAHDNQPITISAKVFEINVPQDLNALLQEEADSVSENVQMAGQVVNGVKALTPVAAVVGAVIDRNNQRQSNERITESNNARAAAADAADAASNQAMLDALSASQQATIDALGAAAAP